MIFHYCPGKMVISLIRFFASIRFAQNDNHLVGSGKGAGSGRATSCPLTPHLIKLVVILSVAKNL